MAEGEYTDSWIIVMLGDNGIGKTTFMHMLMRQYLYLYILIKQNKLWPRPHISILQASFFGKSSLKVFFPFYFVRSTFTNPNTQHLWPPNIILSIGFVNCLQ
ncbi:putative P-loop containing nucleoside triphosphate hydrolase [Helianthus annuus]|nr:putative P-loop containing nucleoside triphosphate hydrolase [Helianthus annuus]